MSSKGFTARNFLGKFGRKVRSSHVSLADGLVPVLYTSMGLEIQIDANSPSVDGLLVVHHFTWDKNRSFDATFYASSAWCSLAGK